MLSLGLLLACVPTPDPVAQPAAPASSTAPGPLGPPLPTPRRSAAADQPNLLVIDIDSMRADALLARWPDGRPVAPHISALAERGVLLRGGVAQAGWTLPSLTTALTGQYPPLFEDDSGEQAVPGGTAPAPGSGGSDAVWFNANARTLPSVLQLYGYETMVFWGQTVPALFPALTRGFTSFHPKAGEGRALRGDPDAYHAPVVRWVEEGPQEPFFLMLHNVDLHYPDPMPPTELRHPRADGVEDCRKADLGMVWEHASAQVGAKAGRRHVEDHYRAALAWYDRSLGEVFAALEAAALERPLVVVIFSDHGESLGEHGEVGHGKTHYEEVLRIPMLVVDPRAPGDGRVVDAAFETLDVAPTLLDLAGAPRDRAMPGRSLVPLLSGEPPEVWTPPAIYSLTNLWSASLRAEPWKLALHQAPGKEADYVALPPLHEVGVELFDLSADPGERVDVAASHPEVVSRMKGDLLTWVAQQVEVTRTGQRAAADPHAREVLRERGYWEAPPPEAR